MTASKELLEQIAREEQELVLPHFDERDAWHLGSILVELAQARSVPVAIDIRRPGHILFHVALPGATPDNDEWIRRKSNVVFRFGKASLSVGVALALAGTTIQDKYYVSPLEFSPHGGAFPIRVAGTGLVACATVSGLPQEEDHALVVQGLHQYKTSLDKSI
ncbi:MAG: heme-degrading domain-containing protein [Spirochaetota bacterium]